MPHSEGDVTVVIKTFERPATLQRMLRSLGPVFAGPVLVADDSAVDNPIHHPKARLLRMPFDSGVGAGRTALLNAVGTEFVLMCDDDFIFLPDFDIGRAVDYLRRNPEVDLFAGRVFNIPHLMSTDYHQQSLFAMEGAPRVRQGTLIDGLPVLYKVPNFYLARAAQVRAVGYDPELKRVDHNDFFTSAYGRLVCVQDRDWRCLHAKTIFDDHYQAFRNDLAADAAYLAQKWRSRSFTDASTLPPDVPHLAEFHAAAILVVARDAWIGVSFPPREASPGDSLRVQAHVPGSLRDVLMRTGWSPSGRKALDHPLWGRVRVEPGGPGSVANEESPRPPPGWLTRATRTAWADEGESVVGAVLPGGPIVTLKGPAATAWYAMGTDGADIDALVNHVVAEFDDAPADAERQLNGTLHQLIDAGLFDLGT